jgi:hypothetical protein
LLSVQKIEIEVTDEEQPTEQPETLNPGYVTSDVENTQTDLRRGSTNTGRLYSLKGRTIIKSMRKLF